MKKCGRDEEEVIASVLNSSDGPVISTTVDVIETSETIISSYSTGNHHVDTATDNTSQSSIIITNEGIVFPPGTLMITDQHEQNSALENEENAVDATDFNIKVEGNPLKSSSLPSNLSDDESDMQNITFINGDHITQFHIQTPLSINDVQNLQKISNRNVLMSQAALPEEVKDGEENMMMDEDDVNNVNHDEESKQFLHDTNLEDSLFIKHEGGGNDVDNSDEVVVESSIKCEQPATVTTTYQPLVYIQVEGEDGNQQFVALTESMVVNNDPDKVTLTHDIGDKKKKGRRNRRIKPFIIPKAMPLEEKVLKSEKLVIGGKSLPLLAPKMQHFNEYSNTQVCSNASNGKSLLKSVNLGSLVVEGGQYFEVLGRCTQCFRFSRTTAYCRAEKSHREPKSSVCLECEATGLSTVVCRRKLNHTAPNALPLNIVINTALQQPEHIKQLCIKNNLPSCFAELQSIVIHHADITFVGNKKNSNSFPPEDSFQNSVRRKPVDYARGYLHPFSKEKWDEWLEKFCKQTSTYFRVRTGKRVNKKSDHGLANHNGKVISYRTLETQLLNCALGGRPRKPRQKDGIRKRKERGSKLIGCQAVMHTRVIQTETGWCALEITIPKILAHLPYHDPRVEENTNYNIVDINELFLTQVNSQLQQNVDQQKQQQQQDQQPQLRFDFLPLQNNDSENDAKKDSLSDEKKRVKNLLLTCASMVDFVESEDILAQLQDSTQTMLSKVLIASNISAKLQFPKQTQQVKKRELISDENSVVENIPQLDEITRIISQVE